MALASCSASGVPLSLKDFRKETREAHTAWTLFQALSVGNPGIFEHMIRSERTQGIDNFDHPKGPKGRFARAHVRTGEGDPEATHMVWRGEKPTGDRALSVMLTDLEERILAKLDLTLAFMPNGEHPRPLGDRYRPVPVLMPASLLGAAWLQFCIYVADFDKGWRLCVACGRPFEVPRRDLTTCPDDKACQKKRQRLEQAG